MTYSGCKGQGTLVVDGRVSADQKVALNIKAEHTARWLEANAVSLLYAKARAYVEYVSAMSPFGVHSLPTIDPYAFLDGVVPSRFLRTFGQPYMPASRCASSSGVTSR